MSIVESRDLESLDLSGEPYEEDSLVDSTEARSYCAILGEELRALRVRQGVSMAVAAAACDRSLSSMSRLESGERRPALTVLAALTSLYDVSLLSLLEEVAEAADPEQKPPRGLEARLVWALLRFDCAMPVASEENPVGDPAPVSMSTSARQ